MDCTQMCHEAHTSGSSPDEWRPAELAQQVSDRQAAVGYLVAARLTADAVVRERLRRRGAELLWPRAAALSRLSALCSLGLCLSACASNPLEPRVCTAIAVNALTVTVVDAVSGQRVCDARVTAIDGSFSEDLRAFGPSQDCSYSGPTERPGRYEVRAARPGYTTAVRSDVHVTADECHVMAVALTLPLTRSAP